MTLVPSRGLFARLGLLLVALVSLTPTAAAQPLSAAEARAIAKEAYIYGFPLVDHYRVQHAYFVDKANPEYKGDWNRIHNEARVYTPKDRAIHTPNADTPYSMLGADLRAEPLVLTMPAVADGRYYVAQFVDLHTHNFAYVGTRATGNGAGRYLLAGPGWKGPTPPGIARVIRSETDLAFVFYRTQLFEPSDIRNVKAVQAGFGVETLSAYLGSPAPKAAAPIAFIAPLTPADERTSPRLFALLDFLLRIAPAHPSEKALRARFARLGIGAAKPFDLDAMSPEFQQALRDGMADAWQDHRALLARIDRGEVGSGDITGNRAHFAGNYLYRMAGAAGGIYGNSKEEAIYIGFPVDTEGQKTDGTHRYRLRFAPGQLPPVRAFWSLTMYDLPDRQLVENALNRYLINSPMLSQLKRDADGGVTLTIQHASPGADREANWLPAPAGPFRVILRAYWPTGALADGSWVKPALERVD
jgi:hypothetical protein